MRATGGAWIMAKKEFDIEALRRKQVQRREHWQKVAAASRKRKAEAKHDTKMAEYRAAMAEKRKPEAQA
jgi:hypothetical protein